MPAALTTFPTGSSEMAARIRAHDWSRTALGAAASWPDALRTIVTTMLPSQFAMLVVWGPLHVCLYNDSYAAVLGQRHPDALGSSLAGVWPDVWAGIEPLVQQAYAGETVHLQDMPLDVTRNGYAETAYFTFSYSPLYGADGQIAGMLNVCVETTGRRAAEAATRHSEARLRELFDTMQEGFFAAEAVRAADGRMTDLRFTAANRGFQAQTGLDPDAIVGRVLADVIPGDHGPLIATYAAVVDTGEAAQFETYVAGLDRWFEARARRTGPDRFSVLFLDITQRRQAEAVLLASERRFRSFAQAMPNQVWSARPDGWLDWFNDQVYRYSGEPVGALDGDNWGAIVHPADLPAAVVAWQASIANTAPYQVQFRVRSADGGYRWHLARAVPVQGDGGLIERWIGTNTDIHDQQAAAEAVNDLNTLLEVRVAERTAELRQANEALGQSQKLEAIGKMTGGVAHDFNNVLQVISGNLQMLRDSTRADAQAHRRLNAAMAGVDRGAKLASQLLAFARKQPLEPVVLNTGRLVRNMDDMLRRALGESVEIETVVAGGLWNTLVDPNRLENALLNLAINARDAMQGAGRLTIETGNANLDEAYARAHEDVQAGQYVLLAVSDTGAGMSPEIMAQVFEPFFTTKPEGHGTGLGLAMVYGFVKQSGGHIKIYSEAGHGTTVKVYLPRSHAAVTEVVAVLDGPVTGGSETILVAEDDAQVRETVVELLTSLGYRVLRSPDAQGALSVLESGVPVDLLFTDVVMPGTLRSPELARRAKVAQPGIAVLFTSGYTENAIVHHGRLDAGVELLSKPYRTEDLARKLRHLLDNRRHLQALAAGQAAALPEPAPTPTTAHPHAPTAAPAVAAPAVVPNRAPLHILVVDDSPEALEFVVEVLQDSGHAALPAGSAEAALELLRERSFDLLVTDIGLPGMSGQTLAEHARLLGTTRIVFASGYPAAPGAPPGTLWLQKPFGFAEIEAMLEAVQRG